MFIPHQTRSMINLREGNSSPSLLIENEKTSHLRERNSDEKEVCYDL